MADNSVEALRDWLAQHVRRGEKEDWEHFMARRREGAAQFRRDHAGDPVVPPKIEKFEPATTDKSRGQRGRRSRKP